MILSLTRRSLAVCLASAVMLIALPFANGARAADDAASVFISTLGSRAVDIMKNKSSTTFEQREAQFKDLLVEGFHIKTISRFVVGKYWKEATDAQKAAYDDIFVAFITRVYAARFDSYSGQTFEMVETIKDPGGDEWVRTKILQPGGSQPIAVDYRVRLFDGQYKVIDVVVEGISMLNTHRVEFASVINKRGLDGLIAELHARLEEPVAAAGQTGG